MLYNLIYFSKSKWLMSEDDLTSLLEESRAWNLDHHLTGMLLYIEGRFLIDKEGRFMQVLEGTQDEVEGIFSKIRTDKRHHQVIVLKKGDITQRSFIDWQMGFKTFDLEKDENLPGFFNLTDDFLNREDFCDPSDAYNFMKSFYTINNENGDLSIGR